jgi:hypothetical protein
VNAYCSLDGGGDLVFTRMSYTDTDAGTTLRPGRAAGMSSRAWRRGGGGRGTNTGSGRASAEIGQLTDVSGCNLQHHFLCNRHGRVVAARPVGAAGP